MPEPEVNVIDACNLALQQGDIRVTDYVFLRSIPEENIAHELSVRITGNRHARQVLMDAAHNAALAETDNERIG